MRRLVLSIVTAIAIASVLLLAGPRRLTLAPTDTGDVALASTLRENAEPGFHHLTAFTLRDGNATFAGVGSNEHTEVEIGSVTKMFTGELTHQLVEEGTLRLDSTVGEFLDVDNAPVADITIKELLDHTSGLPPTADGNFFGFLWSAVAGTNPYAGESTQDIVDGAAAAELSNRGEESYSNLGYALLGHVIETAANTPYETLLKQRIFEPAGLTETYLMTPGAVPADAPRGRTATGRQAQPWEMDGSAPAGAIRSTASDMAKFAEWFMAHGDPAYGWQKNDDGTGFWHNGGTYGYSTMLIIDPKTKRAAFANNDSLAGTEELGQALFAEL
ncbi:serine hydrolase domain-containing protein [Corynebacterium accolens]|jgi:beta-lactamase|uniref:serine hydrolase domain-containing protein n=1 Tax=Corynebacterium accolens TaxID=38284 RepID=UPI00223AC3DF|nr:serine hydrolase domain-containing protein [Corynebacterium accolens]MCT1409199.1 beta-lactamase family protein [Corynebacterium accolens]MDK4244803.1 serine hydrolase domain-containing protein [Corynebacterium accolens]MDK4259792.1 serine hydrolase domain-containing protein [Corynebacterium accolens]MDK4262456.1 serine hydrolase domain-containing protein [Corynebacterium accolens]MDK4270565.1 serine hydrolase domain-containing protein [Corynebacterium accolens]